MDRLNAYCDMISVIARTGESKVQWLHGRFNTKEPIMVKQIDGFEYRADPESVSAEVVNLDNGDPFLSRWADGALCRMHLGRYNSIEKIKEHFDNLGS